MVGHSQIHATSGDLSKGDTGPLPFAAENKLQPSGSLKDTVISAKAATVKEHNMTLWQGIRLYPKAIGWSVLISTCIAMEGERCTVQICLKPRIQLIPPRLRCLSHQQFLRISSIQSQIRGTDSGRILPGPGTLAGCIIERSQCWRDARVDAQWLRI